jgi:hypothetical protein
MPAGELRRQLTDKGMWYGAQVVMVDRFRRYLSLNQFLF